MKKEMQATIRNAARSLYGYAAWTLRLPQATEIMFAAQSSFGRKIKVSLFVVGVVMPLGSLIWVLLFWHSNAMIKRDVIQTRIR